MDRRLKEKLTEHEAVKKAVIFDCLGKWNISWLKDLWHWKFCPGHELWNQTWNKRDNEYFKIISSPVFNQLSYGRSVSNKRGEKNTQL